MCGHRTPRPLCFAVSGTIGNVGQLLVDRLLARALPADEWWTPSACWTVSYAASIGLRLRSHEVLVFGAHPDRASSCARVYAKTYAAYASTHAGVDLHPPTKQGDKVLLFPVRHKPRPAPSRQATLLDRSQPRPRRRPRPLARARARPDRQPDRLLVVPRAHPLVGTLTRLAGREVLIHRSRGLFPAAHFLAAERVRAAAAAAAAVRAAELLGRVGRWSDNAGAAGGAWEVIAAGERRPEARRVLIMCRCGRRAGTSARFGISFYRIFWPDKVSAPAHTSDIARGYIHVCSPRRSRRPPPRHHRRSLASGLGSTPGGSSMSDEGPIGVRAVPAGSAARPRGAVAAGRRRERVGVSR